MYNSTIIAQDEYRVSLVMEYAAGGELLYRKRQRQGLPDAEAKFYAAEIADALQYTHNEVVRARSRAQACDIVKGWTGSLSQREREIEGC